MAIKEIITANCENGQLSKSKIARQWDDQGTLIQFAGYPEPDTDEQLIFRLIVWMRTAEDAEPVELPPIELEADQWLISNYYTQLPQMLRFQLCITNSDETYEKHSPIFYGIVDKSLSHDGEEAEIDVIPLFDPYKKYVDELVVDAGARVADTELNETSTNLVQNKAVATAVTALNGRLDEQAVIEKGRLKGVTDGYDITGSVKTDLYVYAGELVSIDVAEVSGNTNAYISGYTQSDILLISAVGNKERAFQHDGYLAFWCLEDATIKAHVTLKNALSTSMEDFALKVHSIEEEMYKTVSPTLESGAIDTNTGANTSSTTSLRTPDFITDGATILTFRNCKVSIFAYQSDGTFVGGYSATDGWTRDWSKYTRLTSPVYLSNLNENKYQLRLRFDTFTADVTAENANASLQVSRIDELESESEKIEVYTVGAGKDFATFTEMLVSLKDDTKQKMVYVYPGVYDIFEEMGGAEWMQTVDTSLNWRNVCHVVPPNTEIIGLGDVILAWNPTDEQIIDNSHAFLFSPLNVSSSCKIKNIKIHCSNCRYGIHDETSGRAVFDGVTHEFENIDVVYTASTYGWHYAYGAGHNKNCKYKFKNCLFSAAYGVSWSIHDWPATQYEASQFEFDNCRFLNNSNGNPASIRFSSTDKVGRLDDVKINGCVFGSITFGTESSAYANQGYKVTTMLCKEYSLIYSQYILESGRIAPEDYLVIPS